MVRESLVGQMARYALKVSMVVALAMTTGLIGCVESQPPVDRVQPNVTEKSDLLDGSWYFRQTVVDTPYTTDFTFVGESGPLERIEWEIQEEFLIARRAYEHIAGSEPEGINGSTDAAGAAVAMYRIESHFDIRRQYNPVTGEELNVIYEDTQDRPWNERQYMRVDWSENLIADPDFLMLSRYFGGVQTEPVSWFVQDPESPNAPRFERSEDGETLAYMEVTNKMFVEPVETTIWGLTLPSCFLLQVLDGNPIDCASGEITYRNSFLRVDEGHDYQPMVYTGDRMDRAGYFVTERAGYDPAYGLVEPARYRFINRHNLWEESHKRDENGDLIACTTDAQCDDGQGSVCDLDLGRAYRRLDEGGHIEGACTIPFRQRTARPIVYHTTENFPSYLAGDAQEIGRNWSSTFVETVASLRENECLAHGGSDCAAERTREDAQEMFLVCPSPVPADADPRCGAEGTVARIGDLRYSVIGWVNEPHRSSPLGYGPSAADPETGEIISGTAYVYGAGVDTYSAYGRDIVRLLNGDLTPEQIQAGSPVEAWIRQMTEGAGAEGAHERAAQEHIIGVDGHDASRIEAAMDFSWMPSRGRAPRAAPSGPSELLSRTDRAFSLMSESGAFGRGDANARLARLLGTDTELQLTSREHRAMAGIDPNLPVDDSVLDAASPLRSMSAAQRSALNRARARLQEGAGIDHGEFIDEGLLGLARAIQQAATTTGTMEWYGQTYTIGAGGEIDYEAVRDMLRHPIFHGLTLHEIGHTLGLRHNFSGSYDALNYHPRYWELRDDGDMHPRAWDPLSEAEIDGRINEYAYSTVMDYGHNFVVTDAQGVGHYDHFAIKLGYGDLVEVFTETPRDNEELAWTAWFQTLGWPATLTIDAAFGREMTTYPYTEWPALVGGRPNMESRADVPYTSLRSSPLLARSGIDDAVIDQDGRVAVPYRFCSDEQADLGPTCQRYDAGADQYETVQSVIDSYFSYYIFNNFRRGRIGFNVNGTAGRIHGRYFERLQRANQSYALYRNVYEDVFGDTPGFDTFFEREDGLGAFTSAVGAAYLALTRVITSPEPGVYARTDRPEGGQAFTPADGGGGAEIDAFDGRFMETTWDFDAGYFWFDQLERVGYFYDKVIALELLTDPTTYFIGRDTDSDIRSYQINFGNTFGPSLSQFFGGLLAEDWDSIAPRFEGAELVFPDPLEIEQGGMIGTPIDPNASFSIQLYAAVYGMGYIPQTYDQDFLNRSRIWVRGGAEEIEVDPSMTLVEHTDPASGLTYAAVSYMDEEGREHGVGAMMLQRANALAANAASGDEGAARELRSFIDNIDIMRRLTWQLGFGAQP